MENDNKHNKPFSLGDLIFGQTKLLSLACKNGMLANPN